MPYTDIVSFTMAGKKQSSQCQSSQTPTNHTSDESKRVSELLQGTKMCYLTLARSSFKERSQHPECRGDLHRSDQCQRRVQKTHIVRKEQKIKLRKKQKREKQKRENKTKASKKQTIEEQK